MRKINPEEEGLKRFGEDEGEVADVIPAGETWCAMSDTELDIIRSGLFIAIPYMQQVGVSSGEPEGAWGERILQAIQLRIECEKLVSEANHKKTNNS